MGALIRTGGPARTEAQIERHLDIFVQVCRAVEFAHQRGIVHRDLKPDNVIVGAFGEVVVLDWGLAVSLEGDAERELPPASSVRGLAGTPAYMAPELVSGEGAQVGRWTDVYLLGAILHEVFTGAPPHRGGGLAEVLERAHLSAPASYGPEVPTEIADVCHRAMAREPAARFTSVAALREAVRDVGRHRQSVQLAQEARRLLERPTRASLAQARFGFEQALRTWSANPAALDGQREATERELELELADRNLAGAERLLAELPDAPTTLRQRVEALRGEEAKRVAELERLRVQERERAPELTDRVRNQWFVVVAVLWFVIPLGIDLRARAGRGGLTHVESLGGIAFFGLVSVLGIWLTRERTLQNQMGRRLALAFLALVGVVGELRLAFMLLGLPPQLALVPEMLVYGLASALVALLVDGRFRIPAAVYLVGCVAAAAWPEQVLRVMGVANLVALLPMALLWQRLRPDCVGVAESRSGP